MAELYIKLGSKTIFFFGNGRKCHFMNCGNYRGAPQAVGKINDSLFQYFSRSNKTACKTIKS